MAEAQLNRIWRSTGLKIERIVAPPAADAEGAQAGAAGGKLTRQLKTLESLFSSEPHLVPNGAGAGRKRAAPRVGGARDPRGTDAQKYGAVQGVDAREGVYPVTPAQLQRARELESPERRLGVFRARLPQHFRRQPELVGLARLQ